MKYIQLKSRFGLETIDQFETIKEARAMLSEYRFGGDPECYYYISNRACKDWYEREQPKEKQ